MVIGDSYNTILGPNISSIETTRGNIDWTTYTILNVTDQYTASAMFWWRPTGIATRLTFSLTGMPHDVSVHVYEMCPSASLPASLTVTLPTNIKNGCDEDQLFSRGGRDFTVRSGDSIQLTSYPAGSQGIDFTYGGNWRAATSQMNSWSRYIVWWYGLSETDTVTAETIIRAEVFPGVNATVVPAADEAVVTPSTNATDKILTAADVMVATGANVTAGHPGVIASFLGSLARRLAGADFYDSFTSAFSGKGSLFSFAATHRNDMTVKSRDSISSHSTSSSSQRRDDVKEDVELVDADPSPLRVPPTPRVAPRKV